VLVLICKPPEIAAHAFDFHFGIDVEIVGRVMWASRLRTSDNGCSCRRRGATRLADLEAARRAGVGEIEGKNLKFIDTKCRPFAR
jgi:hypothetical protein